MEELRAEIASIFMEQDLGVEPSEGRLQNNAAYIQSWKEEIRENPNALFTAITDADKIAKYVSEKCVYRKHSNNRQCRHWIYTVIKNYLLWFWDF